MIRLRLCRWVRKHMRATAHLMLMLSPPDCKPKVSQVRRAPGFSPPLGFWVRSGPHAKASHFTSTRFEATGYKHGGIRWLPPDPNMPKRLSSSSLSRIPAAGVDPFESIESRRRRLFPQSFPPLHTVPPSSSATTPAQVPRAVSSAHTVERNPNRADAPVLHTSRRGSRAKAAAAARDMDPDVLVQELLADRHAASGIDSAASLLRG